LEETGRSVLVELPMHDVPPYAQPQLVALAAEGVTAVLAHPERNSRVVRDNRSAPAAGQGRRALPVNSGSLLGDFGKEVRKTANSLVAAASAISSPATLTTREAALLEQGREDGVAKIVGEAGRKRYSKTTRASCSAEHTGGDSYQGPYS